MPYDPQLPEFLYKYRAIRSPSDIDRIEQIASGTLYAAGRLTFNDPFDCYPNAAFKASAEEKTALIKKVVARNSEGNRKERLAMQSGARRRLRHDPDQKAKDAVSAVVDRAGIISLSARNDHLLMWGHYGSEHTGICLQFKSEGFTSLSRLSTPLPVIYAQERPTLHFPIADQQRTLEQAFLTKAPCWAYEEEWRVISRAGIGPFSFPKGTLTGVIFGARATDETKYRVREIMVKAHPAVHYMQADLDKSKYDIVVSPI